MKITSEIKVELLDIMGSDLAIVDSARVSFNKQSELSYETGHLKEKDAKLIKYLATHGHMTPFRHNAIQLRCSAPIFLARQLGKHQAGLSWNEVSRRYVKEDLSFYVPELFRKAPEGSVKQGSGEDMSPVSNMVALGSYLNALETSFQTYEGLLKMGVATEMARMVLPQSMMTEWIWTGNLLAFAHVYNERSDSHAQFEAQLFAKALASEISDLFPAGWAELTNRNNKGQ